MARCGDRAVAEDLTSETFLAVAAGREEMPLTVGWLIGVARHKLVDHWRWQARQKRLLQAVEASSSDSDDPWDVELDRLHAHVVLTLLAPQHRAALTLRYLDGLSVPESAAVLGRAWPRPRPCSCALVGSSTISMKGAAMPDQQSDPLDALRSPITPLAPDAAFAADLRDQLVRVVPTHLQRSLP